MRGGNLSSKMSRLILGGITMNASRRSILALALSLAALLSVPAAGHADPVVTNPFGTLQASIVREPSGTTPGVANLTITTANGAITGSGKTVYFGLRIMGGEDMQMTTFSVDAPSAGCIVSDFAGRNTTGGWQGAPVFGAGADPLGSPNSHMRMIGGFLKKACGSLHITVTFSAHPFVAFYGAFFGLTAAPWHDNYNQAPWTALTTGGNYANWWNLWGQFDTLGYSNACTSATPGTQPSCG